MVGKTQFTLKDALAKASGSHGRVKLFLLDEKNKYMGKIEIGAFSARRHFTFFDLIFKN